MEPHGISVTKTTHMALTKDTGKRLTLHTITLARTESRLQSQRCLQYVCIKQQFLESFIEMIVKSLKGIDVVVAGGCLVVI